MLSSKAVLSAQLIEVVLDLGRPPYARLPTGDVRLSDVAVRQSDLDAAIALVSPYTPDNTSRSEINWKICKASAASIALCITVYNQC